MASYNLFKSILAPRSQSTFVYTALKIVLSLFFIVQLIIIVLLFAISIFQFQFNHLFDHAITFGLFLIVFLGIGLESLPILFIAATYFIIYFFNSFHHNFVMVSYFILFFDAFGLLTFGLLTLKGVTTSLPDE